MNRRIVTDGNTFRIQCRDPRYPNGTWTFYPGEYKTYEQAALRMEQWNQQDREENDPKWKVVEEK